jgi:hypothetical protein
MNNQWGNCNKIVTEQQVGIEPTSSRWQRGIIPLYYCRVLAAASSSNGDGWLWTRFRRCSRSRCWPLRRRPCCLGLCSRCCCSRRICACCTFLIFCPPCVSTTINYSSSCWGVLWCPIGSIVRIWIIYRIPSIMPPPIHPCNYIVITICISSIIVYMTRVSNWSWSHIILWSEVLSIRNT